MITLPYNLGGHIRDFIDTYRKEKNIPEPTEIKQLSVYRRRDTFLESELELVTEINIDKKTIEYIYLFPNIKSITIDSVNELTAVQLNELLEKYPDLEKLRIKGQNNLQYLDISNLKKLEELELISNDFLHRVDGLDRLNNLKKITFYDNITYQREEELCEIVSKLSQKGVHCNLDVLYMPTIKTIDIYIKENFNWCESIGLGYNGEEIKYTTNEVEKAVDKAKEIVTNYIEKTDSTIQKYAILYEWVCENIKYDYDTSDNTVGKLGGTNGTVNGLVYGKCVCEGYSKSMQMLLKYCNIPSFDIGCIAENITNSISQINIDGRKRIRLGDHSILKVNLDGKIYYSDITWDANRYQKGKERKYFLLSKEDILKDHKLIGEEQVIAYPKSISSEEFQKLFLFAKSRINSVNKRLEEQKKTKNERILNTVSLLNETHLLEDDKKLITEQATIIKKLKELYYDGKIDLKTYNNMKLELLNEYNSMFFETKDDKEDHKKTL